MKIRMLAVALVGAGLTAGATGLATAASHPAPKRATIKQKGGFEFKANRYVKSKLRWYRDVYRVRSGGTLTVVSNIVNEGPHTFTVVRKRDLPTSFDCKVCEELGMAHGADPESEGPPANPFLEDGVASETPPEVNKPGDSAFVAPKEQVDLKVTAPKNTKLYFVCLIHPWMQAKVIVG